MNHRVRLFKNTVANLLRGGAIAVFTLCLPPFLVRHMAANAYAIWLLILQAAAYVGYFDFGLQTALGRYIAFAEERKDASLRDSTFSTALLGLAGAGTVSLLLLLGLILALPHIFPAVPHSLLGAMRWTILITGLSVALGLPASAWNAVFIGLQKNEIPALTTGGAKLLAAAGIVLAVLAGRSFLVMGLILAACNLLAYAAQYMALRQAAPELHFQRKALQRAAAKELFQYSFAITIMSIAMLLVSGLDVMLVGRFEFHAVIPYAASSSFIPLITGLLYAVLNTLIPHAARIHAQGAPAALGKMVISSTRISVLLLMFTGLPPMIYAVPILKLWIGPAYTPEARNILIVLLAANIIRLSGAAYSIVLIASAQQRLIKVSPMAEGISNLAASLVLGMTFGAIGIALGTLIGALVSIIFHLFYSMPRTRTEIPFKRLQFVWSGLALPALCTSPLLAASVWATFAGAIRLEYFCLAMCASLAASAYLLYSSNMFGSRHKPTRATLAVG